MKLLEKILVLIDFRKSTDNLINAATSVAKNYDSEIILINVLPSEANIESFEGILVNFAEKKINLIKSKLENKGINVGMPIIKYGSKIDNILRVSQIENVNLIIVSSDCYDDDDDNIKLSHFAEKLTRKSEKPVWVINQSSNFKITNILCPIDFSNASERAFKNAIQLSRKYKAELTVLNVYEPVESISQIENEDIIKENEDRKKVAAQTMDNFLNNFSFSDISFNKKLISGKAAKVILKTIKDYDHDLLVMGTTGKTGLGRILIGSITEKVIRELPCSFITTKSTDIIDLKLENEIKDIEVHLKIAKDLEKKGFYDEAIRQYNTCLEINSMHIPSYFHIARLYKKNGQENKADFYEKMATEQMDRIWDKNIELEIRKYYIKY
jgi:nucleotide-binding universal stress UspA family protein